jgi:signal transduction histidine kinase
MRMRQSKGIARPLLAAFPFVLPLLAGAFAWLAWREIGQERLGEQERTRALVGIIADRIQASLQSAYANLESQTGFLLAGLPPSGEIPDNVVLLLVDAFTLKVYPERRLLYYPDQAPGNELSPAVFRAGEDLEYLRKDPAAAALVYRRLAASEDPKISAGAHFRLVRALREAGRYDEALAACAGLERLDPVVVETLPAGLRARQFRCRILEQLGKAQELEREAAALHQDLLVGRWHLPRSEFEYALDKSRSGAGGSERATPSSEDLALAAAAEQMWNRRTEELSGGHRFTLIENQPVLLAWSTSPGKLAAVVAGPRYLRALLRSVPHEATLQVGLSDAEGRILLGAFDARAQTQVARTAAATRMPWSLHLSAAGSLDPEYTRRHRLLLAGLALITATLLGGAYLSWHALSKELAVARLQSEFVSAVSHEFRSPLTALRQISELLARDRVPSEDHRSRFYETLARESRRLHWLVENLLDFGSMEAGSLHYALEKLDLSGLTRTLAGEFQDQIGGEGHRIEVSAPPKGPAVRADPEALGRVLWNLLDNAVKYSPDSQRILVEISTSDAAWAAVKVQDFGLGIAPAEQKEIFRKFVRGSEARARAIKGTGLGLAMVEHIVRAHGGEIRLVSEPGRGSTFTILLPIERDA